MTDLKSLFLPCLILNWKRTGESQHKTKGPQEESQGRGRNDIRGVHKMLGLVARSRLPHSSDPRGTQTPPRRPERLHRGRVPPGPPLPPAPRPGSGCLLGSNLSRPHRWPHRTAAPAPGPSIARCWLLLLYPAVSLFETDTGESGLRGGRAEIADPIRERPTTSSRETPGHKLRTDGFRKKLADGGKGQ